MMGFFDADKELDYSIFSREVVLEDARLPDFRVQGLEAYRTALGALRWSVRAASDAQRFEITAMSPPVRSSVYVRWRLHLWPKDPLAPAIGLLTPALAWNSPLLHRFGVDEPMVFEGYSRYEFDPWSAEVVSHTIEITNPPMDLADLLDRHVRMPVFGLGARLPQAVPLAPVAVAGSGS